MKFTGRRVYLSGGVQFDTADAVRTDGGGNTTYFQNIMVDERVGYAYKVTFMSSFPNVASQGNQRNIGYALQSYSRRELLRMTNDELTLAAGLHTYLDGSGTLAASNRTIGVYGSLGDRGAAGTNYQNQYVIKGDAMVTQSLSICVDMSIAGQTDSACSYYIELEEYEVSDNEEILLILNERAQDARGLSQ